MPTLGERKETEVAGRLLKFFLLGSRLLGPTLGGGRSCFAGRIGVSCEPSAQVPSGPRGVREEQTRERGVGLWGWKLGVLELEHQNPSFAHDASLPVRVSQRHRVPAEESCLNWANWGIQEHNFVDWRLMRE
jgi:hypothetical protein